MVIGVGVDCGATNLRVGVFNRDAQLLFSHKAPSPLKFKADKLALEVKNILESYIVDFPNWQIQALGIGTPGPLDLEKGLILPSSNVGNKEPINLMDQFKLVFDTKLYFDRDTNLALWGEAWQGAAVGNQDVVMLTLGSGVGGALMVNGQIERGVGGKAGEIGHMVIGVENGQLKPQNVPVCGLGHQGCLEAWINSAKDLDELGVYLGLGLANVVDIFNPEKIIIGGGKIWQGDFLPQAIKTMKEIGTEGAVDEVEVVYAKLKDESGVYGAGRLSLQL